MKSTDFLPEAELDPSGWGQTPIGSNVDYLGLKVKMRPSVFLKLANPLGSEDENPEVAKYMQSGGKIAHPFLEIRDPVEWEQGDFRKPAEVVGHEGRNRMTEWIKLKGNDPIQVNLYLKNANRRRYITPEMIAELSRGIISEWGYYIRNPFEASTALEEGWRSAAAAGAAALGLLGSTPKIDAPVQTPLRPVLQEPAGMMTRMSPIEKTLMYTAKNQGIKGSELAQLLAQCAHETAGFSKMEEQGSTQYLTRKYDPKYSPRIAKKLGNIKPGDGVRYKGRGLVQLTGRDNYARAGRALNLPLLDQPELAADPKNAIAIAMWYWNNRVQPRVDDFNDTAAVTRTINPGLKGLDDRHTKFVNYSRNLYDVAK